MEVVNTAKALEDVFEFTPVEGRSDLYLVGSKHPRTASEEEMTDADWDKFEQDIEDAFEQIP